MAIFNSMPTKHGTDTSTDTVTPETLLRGITAHDAAGNMITGAHVCETAKWNYGVVGQTFQTYIFFMTKIVSRVTLDGKTMIKEN